MFDTDEKDAKYQVRDKGQISDMLNDIDRNHQLSAWDVIVRSDNNQGIDSGSKIDESRLSFVEMMT